MFGATRVHRYMPQGNIPSARTRLPQGIKNVPLLSRRHGIDRRTVHVVVPSDGTDSEGGRGDSREVRGCGSFAGARGGGTLFKKRNVSNFLVNQLRYMRRWHAPMDRGGWWC